MPAAAAAAVTSGSLAAPSSIEYSVCTCRCTKESDGVVLTGAVLLSGRACPPPAKRRATGGEDRQCGRGGGTGLRRYGVEAGGAPILALRTVYSEGLTERVSAPPDRSTKDPLPPPLASSRRVPAGGRSEPAAHRDVRDAGLLVLLPHGAVARSLVETTGAHPGVQLDLLEPEPGGLPVQFGQDGVPVAPAADSGVGRHPADDRPSVPHDQPAGGHHRTRGVPAQDVHRGGVRGVLLDLGRDALLLDEDPGAQGRHLAPVAGRGDRRGGQSRGGPRHCTPRPDGSKRAGTSRKRRSIAAWRTTGRSNEPLCRYSAAITPPSRPVATIPEGPW